MQCSPDRLGLAALIWVKGTRTEIPLQSAEAVGKFRDKRLLTQPAVSAKSLSESSEEVVGSHHLPLFHYGCLGSVPFILALSKMPRSAEGRGKRWTTGRQEAR